MGFLRSSLRIVSELKAACPPLAANCRRGQAARVSSVEAGEAMVRHDRALIRRSIRLSLEECGLGGSSGGFRGRHCLSLNPSGYLTVNSEKNKCQKIIQKIKATEYLADYRALSPLLLSLSQNKQLRYRARAKRKPIDVKKTHPRRISLWGMIHRPVRGNRPATRYRGSMLSHMGK